MSVQWRSSNYYNNGQVVCILFVLLLVFYHTHAFVPVSSKASTTTIKLNAGRRQLFEGLQRVMVFGGLINTVKPNPSIALEDLINTNEGRVVSIELNNIDGVQGQTGTIKIQLQPTWAPRGVKRFEELTENGFWHGCRIFRVIPGFVAQFGINGNPEIQKEWRSASIPDDPVKVPNKRGTVVFATGGPNARTTQIFINTREEGNEFLDKQGFAPIGYVSEGMDLVDRFFAANGDDAATAKGPDPGLIQQKGNAYLQKNYPNLTYIAHSAFSS